MSPSSTVSSIVMLTFQQAAVVYGAHLKPFTLPPRAAAAFHAALLRALPLIAEQPNGFYELFERELLGSDIPTADAWLHLAGKQSLLKQLLVVMEGDWF